MSEKETKKTAAQIRTAAAKHENIMYVGPSISGVAVQNTVYTEIPEGAVEAIKSCPAIRNLFVEIRAYSKAEEMIRTRSGHIYAAFEQAAKYGEERRLKSNG